MEKVNTKKGNEWQKIPSMSDIGMEEIEKEKREYVERINLLETENNSLKQRIEDMVPKELTVAMEHKI